MLSDHPRLSRLVAPLAAIGLLLAIPQPATAQPHTPGGAHQAPAPLAAGAEPDSGLWLVELAEPPLASYSGGTADLAATSPAITGDATLDVAAPASVAYLEHLAAGQAEALTGMEDVLGRSIDVEFTYQKAFNGLALHIDAGEAAVLAELPEVASVSPDEEFELATDVSHDVIGSAAIWEGDTGTDVGTRGEGVVVGMLDSGVNPDHPSFAAVDGDGYQHTNPFGSGTYVGVCDPDDFSHEDICNDKLIGAWNFAVGSLSARDEDGHGSHVGSTIAGNRHEAAFTVGEDEYTRTVAGVAPRANVISYKVCSPGCFASASVAAVDQAIEDGVDVLNFSISGPDNPWGNVVDQAFLRAFQAGVFVSASAGNNGPGAGTVAKTAPWNATVAATNHHRLIAHGLEVTAPDPVPPQLVDLAAVPGEGPPLTAPVEGPVTYSGTVDPDNAEGCTAFGDEVFDGAVALIPRGGCTFEEKVNHASAAGAIAVVIFNQFAGPGFVMGGLADTTIPSVMLTNEDGQRLRDHLADHPSTEIRINTDTVLELNEGWADIMTDFSSRGPSQFDLLAPTFAAPGRGILAAAAPVGDDPEQYRFMRGTSMSSPHFAGAGALLTALHPEWSPAQIRSALAATADPSGLLKQDGVTAADPFDAGSGLLDLASASRVGIVLDETHDNFEAANPATGGDPRTLNLPAMVDQNCDDVCSWSRELTSVATVEADYTVAVNAPEGLAITVEPSEFTLAPGATQELTVTADVTELIGGDWLFASLALSTDALHSPDGPEIAGVHFPIALVPAEAELVVDPLELSSLQDVAQQVTQPITISNTGGAELEWDLTEAAADCAEAGDVSWVQADVTSGSVAPGEEQEVQITFDSTGLTGGLYEAVLCIGSNDPHHPMETVTLTMEVIEIPRIDVTPDALAAEQPAGTTTAQNLQVGNVGHGTLEWSLAEEGAGASEERLELLRDGVLLVPNSAAANRGVMAFDPHTGDLIDAEFIEHVAFDPSSTLYTPKHILPKPDGSGFLMSDQVRWMITEYDLEGNFVGVFAPIGGERDPETMANLRGMTWSPDGTLLVTVAAQNNAHSIVELDADGNYLGTFIEPGLGGMTSPWYVLVRDDDVLVSASGSSAIHSFSRDGTEANAPFAELNWPAQMVELDNGNILTVNWSGAGGAGVREFDAEGNLLGEHVAAGSSYAGVYPLGNGNILTTTSTGVYEIDRAGEVFNTKFDGGRARYVTHVQLPDARPCVTPDEVSWLQVGPDQGATAAGDTTEVAVRFDSTGLAPGDYEARLCVTSDDPDTPLVPVPVTMTVTAPGCDTTVTGSHRGPLTVRDGLTCLADGAEVSGPVSVQAGAGLFASGASVRGPVSASGAATVELRDTTVAGPVTIAGVTDSVTLSGNDITGPVTLLANATGEEPIVVAGNQIDGPLSCVGNVPPPTDGGEPNEVTGPTFGQCAQMGT